MIEHGKIKPYQKIWMIDGWPSVREVEYLRHWGTRVRVRMWHERIVTKAHKWEKVRREEFTDLINPEQLFDTRADAEAQLDARIANLQKRRAALAPVKEYIEGELV